MPGTRFTEITDEQFNAASKRAEASSSREQRATAARYDSRSGKVVVTFASGIELRIPPKAVQALERARASDLRRIEISPSGQGIHFPAIDADVFLPSLLAGQTGTRAWMAAQIGRMGGRAVSQAKITAARANGRKGGRPRRPVSPSP